MSEASEVTERPVDGSLSGWASKTALDSASLAALKADTWNSDQTKTSLADLADAVRVCKGAIIAAKRGTKR